MMGSRPKLAFGVPSQAGQRSKYYTIDMLVDSDVRENGLTLTA